MAHLNPATGLWEDDASGPAAPNQPGALGAQVDTPTAAPLPPMAGPPLPGAQAPVQGPPVPVDQLPEQGPPAPVPILDAPVAAPAPAVPPVTPYKPQTPGPLPTPDRVVSPAEVGTLGQIDANTAARATTEQQQGQLGGQKAAAVADQAARDEAERQRHATEQQQIIDDGAKRVQDLQTAASAKYAEYRAMGVKDPEADQSFGHKLLAAIAIGLGQYASMRGGGPNRAADLIKQANDQNIALQKDAIEKKYREAQLAGADVTQAKADEQEALHNLSLKDAAITDSSAAKLKTELARMGVPEQQIAANRDVQQMEADALQKREAVNTSIRSSEEQLTKADIAAHARAKAKGAGGAGGGSTDALTQFYQAAGALKPGDPIPADVAVLARKAGLKPNQIATEVDRLRGSGNKAIAGQDRANAPEAKAAAAADAGLQKELYPPSGKGPGTQLERIQAMRGELKDAIANGDKTAATRVIEEAGGMLSGGKTTKTTVGLLEELKSTGDKLTNSWNKITGDPGDSAAYTARLDKLLGGAEHEKQAEVDAITKRHAATRAQTQPGASAAPAQVAPAEKMAAARRVAADPNAPAAARARALQFINAGQ